VETLLEDPNIEVNWRNPASSFTSLHLACFLTLTNTVKALLAHPKIDVNLKDKEGCTPLGLVCKRDWGRDVLVILLADPRVLVNEVDNSGSSPLKYLAHKADLERVRLMIASGRVIDVEGITSNYSTPITFFLSKYRSNPQQATFKTRVSLGYPDAVAAQLFAQVVFVSDGLIRVREVEYSNDRAKRFINLAARLPMELQMVLCYRLAGSARNNIAGADREAAFKDITKWWLLLPKKFLD